MKPERRAAPAPVVIGTLILLAAALVLGGCSSATRDRWLRTLFDDPPTSPPETQTLDSVLETTAPDTAAAVIAAAEIFEHGPFAAGDCRACHDLGGTRSFRGGPARGGAGGTAPDLQDGRLVAGADRLCTGCHGDLSSETLALGQAVVHAPLTSGGCLFCHHPHQSEARFLLRRSPPRVLCLQCHNQEALAEVAGHAAPADRTCLGCHDPHASGRKALLRGDEP